MPLQQATMVETAAYKQAFLAVVVLSKQTRSSLSACPASDRVAEQTAGKVA